MNNDIILNENNISFNCRVAAIIVKDDRILLQKRISDAYWALPGGKIKFGETSKEALYRELYEELKIDNISRINMIDVSEHFFNISTKEFHQYIFTYKVELFDYDIISQNFFIGKEEHNNLIFKWEILNKIDWSSIKPDYLKDQVFNPKKRKYFRIYKESSDEFGNNERGK